MGCFVEIMHLLGKPAPSTRPTQSYAFVLSQTSQPFRLHVDQVAVPSYSNASDSCKGRCSIVFEGKMHCFARSVGEAATMRSALIICSLLLLAPTLSRSAAELAWLQVRANRARHLRRAGSSGDLGRTEKRKCRVEVAAPGSGFQGKIRSQSVESHRLERQCVHHLSLLARRRRPDRVP